MGAIGGRLGTDPTGEVRRFSGDLVQSGRSLPGGIRGTGDRVWRAPLIRFSGVAGQTRGA